MKLNVNRHLIIKSWCTEGEIYFQVRQYTHASFHHHWLIWNTNSMLKSCTSIGWSYIIEGHTADTLLRILRYKIKLLNLLSYINVSYIKNFIGSPNSWERNKRSDFEWGTVPYVCGKIIHIVGGGECQRVHCTRVIVIGVHIIPSQTSHLIRRITMYTNINNNQQHWNDCIYNEQWKHNMTIAKLLAYSYFM